MTAVDEATQKRIEEFRKELDSEIASHRVKRRIDGFLHQGLIIGAALAGFVSLGVGAITKDATWAGVIGALTSVATILAQQLHCVKAQTWHDRIATELDGIRTQLLYELKPTPSSEDVAALAKQARLFKAKMTEEWETVLSSQPTKLGVIKPA
jgi:hypothetical protein